MFDDDRSKAVFDVFQPSTDISNMPIIYQDQSVPTKEEIAEFEQFMESLVDDFLSQVLDEISSSDDAFENAFVAVLSGDGMGVFKVVESHRICDHVECFVYAMEEYIKDNYGKLLDTYDGIESVIETTTDRQGNPVMVGSFRLVDLFDLH